MDVTTWLDDCARRDAALRASMDKAPSEQITELTIGELRARLREAESDIALREKIMSDQTQVIERLNSMLGRGHATAPAMSEVPSFDNMLRYYAAKSPATVAAVLSTSARGTRFALSKAQGLAAKVRR